jgi:hypothetical protein
MARLRIIHTATLIVAGGCWLIATRFAYGAGERGALAQGRSHPARYEVDCCGLCQSRRNVSAGRVISRQLSPNPALPNQGRLTRHRRHGMIKRSKCNSGFLPIADGPTHSPFLALTRVQSPRSESLQTRGFMKHPECLRRESSSPRTRRAMRSQAGKDRSTMNAAFFICETRIDTVSQKRKSVRRIFMRTSPFHLCQLIVGDALAAA